MKINLMETGLRNIKELAKQYQKAIIYFHIDLDGVTSAIAMKEYLKRYGIATVDARTIQYGDSEYSIAKPNSPDILPVLVDFAHGKAFMKIHTDHHDHQIEYQGSSNHFSHSKSNAETISSVISMSDVFSKEDISIINMIDSAGFADEGVSPEEIIQTIIKLEKEKGGKANHRMMGMIAGKLLLVYKNKPNFLKTVVLQSNPSLMSMYNVITSIMKEKITAKERGWFGPQDLNKHGQDYLNSQKDKAIKNGSVDDINSLRQGASVDIDGTIVQIGGGNMMKAGSYDRYTAYKLHPESKYFIMIWDQIGMMQVSKNPWNKASKEDGIHLGELVLKDIFQNKYYPLLDKPKYKVSLLALKKASEAKINDDNEKDASGFTAEEMQNAYGSILPKLSDKQLYVMKKYLNYKPSQLSADTEEAAKARNFLNSIKLSLPDIILSQSGGHPGITNMTGFAFYEEQKRIDRSMARNANPYYVPPKKKKIKEAEEKKIPYDSTSVKIIKSIAKDVVERLAKG